MAADTHTEPASASPDAGSPPAASSAQEVRSDASIGIGFSVAFALAALAALVIAATVLGGYGRASRWSPAESAPQIVNVDDARGAFEAWRASGVRNAVLVDATSRFGFQTVPFGVEVVVPNSYPVRQFDITRAFAEKANRDNSVWVASQLGMFRTIYYVLTPGMLGMRVSQGRSIGAVGIAADGSHITPNNNGYLRHIAAEVPRIDGPLVLNVDAAYFEDGDPKQLAEQLASSGDTFALVTLDHAVDDTATTDAARARLDEFGALIGAVQ